MANFFKTLATVLALSELGDMALDTLLGDLSLDFAGRALCIDNGDFVFVYAGGGLLEEVSASATKDRWAPIDPSVLFREDKG